MPERDVDLGGLTVDDIERETLEIMGVRGVDPMRPQDIVAPPGLYTNPPLCRECRVFLHPVNTNTKGDVHLECLACGYVCVWRGATRAFEPFPGRAVPDGWQPPTLKFNRKPVAVQDAPARQPVTSSEGEDMDAWCSPREAAQRLGVDVSTIGSYLADGRLTFKTIDGRKIRIPVVEIEALRKRGGDIDRG